MELGCTTHTWMDKTTPRNFRTTDQHQNYKVEDFFQKSIIYGFGQFGWTKSFQKIFGHGVRQVATVLNKYLNLGTGLPTWKFVSIILNKHLDLGPGLPTGKFCSNNYEEVFGLWARKNYCDGQNHFIKYLDLGPDRLQVLNKSK